MRYYVALIIVVASLILYYVSWPLGFLEVISPPPVADLFIKDPGNPLDLPYGPASGCLHPDVKYFPEGRSGYRFWMYYTPWPPDSAEYPYLARSNDTVNFTSEDVVNPLFTPGTPGSWDDSYLADVDVMLVNDTWMMYYAGCSSDQCSIGLALSGDGVNWRKYRSNPVIPEPSVEPTVVLADGSYHMWYSCNKKSLIVSALSKMKIIKNMFVCYATSEDGISWDRHGTVDIPPTYYNIHANVVFDDGTFHMMRRARDGISLAYYTSEDGIDWELQGYVLSPSPEERQIYRSSQLESPLSDDWVELDGSRIIYYSYLNFTEPGFNTPRIGLAIEDTV
ncbi:MAG: hypothetical protein GF416_01235 [Candidatus Altiarchaeales archaeon]|nr:hypothetical protein [Candidatus Altiarchaeales archaeon]MBD3415739.1 hypothetical protein [Candidatus Altiarchaeales archaeon]